MNTLALAELNYFFEEFQVLDRAGEKADAGRVERVLAELSRFIVDEEAQRAFEALEPDKTLHARCRYIQAQAARCCSLLELAQARAVAADRPGLNRYLQDVSESALAEMHGTGIGGESSVLFIGSGAFPVTAIALARSRGCRVLCSDTHEPVVAASRSLFAALGLGERLAVSGEPLEALYLSGFTHVYLASLVPDKESLLEELHPRLGPDTTVLVRYGNGLKRLFNYGLARLPEERWLALSRRGHGGTLYDTILLKKR